MIGSFLTLVTSPHLIASSLSSHLSSNPKKWSEMAGQGLKDTTRVAQGDPALWCEIMKSNHRNLSKSLELWIESVNRIGISSERGIGRN